jgi:hypothetical protein
MTAATTTRSRNARKVLGSLAVVGAAAAVAGMGTFGSFTDSTAPLAASVSSGTLALDLTGTNGLTMGGTNLVPGDTVSSRFQLVNGGDLDMAAIGLSVTATTSSILDTDKTDGLKLSIDSCSVAWAADNTCAGVTSSVMALSPATTPAPLTNLTSTTARKTDNLLVKLTLPTSADNRFQTKSSVLSLVFTGTQKTGTNR